MTREYVEQRMREKSYSPPDKNAHLYKRIIDEPDAVDVALALVQEAIIQRVDDDAELADAYSDHVCFTEPQCERTSACRVVHALVKERERLRAAARKPEREGGGE